MFFFTYIFIYIYLYFEMVISFQVPVFLQSASPYLFPSLCYLLVQSSKSTYTSLAFSRNRLSFSNRWMPWIRSSLSSVSWKQECDGVWPIRVKLLWCQPINAEPHCTDMYRMLTLRRETQPNETLWIRENAGRTISRHCNECSRHDVLYWELSRISR